MAARDYYDILGVARRASDEEIKKAYRKLVRQYHPDVSKDKSKASEQKFKEVQEAYEVLSDPKKRAAYDQFGHAGVGMGAGASPGGAGRTGYGPGGAKVYTWTGSDFPGAENLGVGDIFSEIFGGTSFGRRAGTRARSRSSRGKDVEHNVTLTFEQAVWGTTMRLQLQRPNSQGNVRTETIDIKIPPGVCDGARVRVRSKGDPGFGGAEAGDLYIVAQVKAHPYFHRDGKDVYLDVPITTAEAIRGAKITIPTIDGPTVVTVPPGTSSGQKLRLRGKGAPDAKTGQRGDQYAVIKLVVPKQPPEGIDEALDRIQQASGDPRSQLGWAI